MKLMNGGQSYERIDLVEIEGHFLFTYTNDWFYRARTTEKSRGKTYRDIVNYKNKNKYFATKNVDEFIDNWNETIALDLLVLALLFKHSGGRQIGLIDVGCLYGLVSMDYAKFCKNYGVVPCHFAFDPGLAGNLTSSNFINNGYTNIKFYPYAISDFDGYVRLNYEIGNNEDSRIVNPGKTVFSFNNVVKSIRLDTFLKDYPDLNSIFVKIDTQGAEKDVFEGLEQTLKQRTAAGIFEFAPGCLGSTSDSIFLLELFRENYYLYDVGARRNRLVRIHPGKELNIVNKASSGQYAWTDIVFIPKNMNCADVIERKLQNM